MLLLLIPHDSIQQLVVERLGQLQTLLGKVGWFNIPFLYASNDTSTSDKA